MICDSIVLLRKDDDYDEYWSVYDNDEYWCLVMHGMIYA